MSCADIEEFTNEAADCGTGDCVNTDNGFECICLFGLGTVGVYSDFTCGDIDKCYSFASVIVDCGIKTVLIASLSSIVNIRKYTDKRENMQTSTAPTLTNAARALQTVVNIRLVKTQKVLSHAHVQMDLSQSSTISILAVL